MKAKHALEILQVTRVTLSRYVKEGRIRYTKKANGQYEYNDDDIYAFVGKRKEKHGTKIISYARVTENNRRLLKDQSIRIYDSCTSRGITLDEQFEDIGSCLDNNRNNFNKICQMIFKGEVDTLVIESKDRLTRFDFDMLEQFFKYFGTSILVLNNIENATYESEVTDDLISVIKDYGKKLYLTKKQLSKIKSSIESACKK